MVSYVNNQTITGEFESHWEPHSYGLIPHLSQTLCKSLLRVNTQLCFSQKYTTKINSEKENDKHTHTLTLIIICLVSYGISTLYRLFNAILLEEQ